MNREELTEMIRSEIRSLAFETLRTNAKDKNDKKSRIFKPKGLTEDELEYALFHGGNKPEKGISKRSVTTIREAYDSGIPQINSSDITQFEDSFEEMLKEIDGASVVFDKQSNGYSLNMGIGAEGIEAGASGTIEMGNDGKINWAYSLKNGLTVSMEDLNVDQGNKRVLERLYNNYDAWQKDWREKLTIQPGEEVEGEMAPPEAPAPEAPAPEAPAGEEPLPLA